MHIYIKVQIKTEISKSRYSSFIIISNSDSIPNKFATPIRARGDEPVEDAIERLLIKNKIYAFGERTPGRSDIKPEDKICFYASGKGVMAYATVASSPVKKPHNAIKDYEKYPWVFDLKDAKINYENPIVINASVRAKLDAFQDKDPTTTIWSWFVQCTRKVSENDFKILTVDISRKTIEDFMKKIKFK